MVGGGDLHPMAGSNRNKCLSVLKVADITLYVQRSKLNMFTWELGPNILHNKCPLVQTSSVKTFFDTNTFLSK